MAIFEQETPKKVLLDDTEPLSCVIENWRNVNGHTEYIIKVQRGPFVDKCWRIYKRYNDFVALNSQLHISGLSLSLPPKKLVGNLDPEFISQRQQGLQKYLNSILMNPILVSSLPAKSFIDPANYCQPFSEIALQHVSLALRGEVGWEVIGPLTDIGWRLRKHYYQVRCKSAPKDELIASWTDFGPDKQLEEKDLQAVFKSLIQLKHPYIYPIKLCLCTDVGALMIRASNPNGSLRDILYQVKPRQSFMKKYGNPKGHKALNIGQVALYGKQILEALKFLQEKGLPYGHLHVGNVIVENDKAKLVDIENGILGVPSFYRPYFMQHRRITTLEAIDVYCFGHTVYEMAFGTPLQESNLENLPADCPHNLRSLLESILSAEAFKNGMPTLEALLNHNFFASIILTTNDKVNLKIPPATRDQLKTSQFSIEERLRDEQKMMRSQKRLVRVQEMMSSEEEKKKQRNKKKQELKKQAKDREKRNSQEEPMHREKNGSNGERTDSMNSASTATSIGTATPPSASGSSRVPSPPQLPPPPLPPSVEHVDNKRTALLGAITNFDKSALRKAKLAD